MAIVLTPAPEPIVLAKEDIERSTGENEQRGRSDGWHYGPQNRDECKADRCPDSARPSSALPAAGDDPEPDANEGSPKHGREDGLRSGGDARDDGEHAPDNAAEGNSL